MQGYEKLRIWQTRLAAVIVILLALSTAAPVTRAEAQGLSFIRDTEIEQLLNDYAQPIFRAAGLGAGRITMRIIRHESFNAFVLDGRICPICARKLPPIPRVAFCRSSCSSA
jgi:predicted Zn-dependent protease